ncbi:hypothetical protein ACQU0X_25855 [Pseudovibrio ascidiaceicola]|uniref:hypothetical protein n=1 Tax=Pseudovibrio ascidiaceicola TaxID=285279 RepID=UPI003D367C18
MRDYFDYPVAERFAKSVSKCTPMQLNGEDKSLLDGFTRSVIGQLEGRGLKVHGVGCFRETPFAKCAITGVPESECLYISFDCSGPREVFSAH